MTTVSERGFTIIEVVLFLAITGALFAALMIGINLGVTQQRYLDSVRSYKALIQNEYSATLNTNNELKDGKKCDTSDGKIDDGTRDDRGTSRCVVLGRAIQISPDGHTATTSSVTSLDWTGSGSAIQNSNDIDVFKNFYKPYLSDYDKQSIDLDWGSYLTTNTTPSSLPANQIILILRSPVSGILKVFVSASRSSTAANLTDVITPANASQPLKNCIKSESSGFLPKQLVTINPLIASADAVTLDGGDNEVCQS